MSVWERRQWALAVGVLVLVVLVLLALISRPSVQQAGPASVTVRVVNGPTVLSTQVVPLR